MEDVYGTRVGVFSGSMADDYKHIVSKDVDVAPKYAATGTSFNMIANRISWFFNFLGPSVTMDSACSSSLMALDFAVQSLQNGISDMVSSPFVLSNRADLMKAFVTGSSMILAVEPILSLMSLSMLSPDGRCYSFDERANGYSRGEGFSVVLLKRLDDAIRDGNTIRAIIRSTGSNSDGHTAGLTQPSKDSQAMLIRETYQKAGLDMASTRFFEAHGTGTPLGDPIEAEAIGTTFRNKRAPDDPLYVGALKSNIGHLEGGSGLAGLIKTVLVLEKGIIPPNANFSRLNPKIDAEFMNLKFPERPTAWPSRGLRRASVNSFGFGGSNAHVVIDDAYHFLESRGIEAAHCTVEEPPLVDHDQDADGKRPILSSDQANGSSNKVLINGHGHGKFLNGNATVETTLPQVLIWSAADEAGIDRLMDQWGSHFSSLSFSEEKAEKNYLRQLSYTLSSRRSTLSWKAYAIVTSVSQARKVKEFVSRPARSPKNHGIGYLFTGQGAQYNGMGMELLAWPVFRDAIELFDRELMNLGCCWSVLDELMQEQSSERIHEPKYSQPLTTALEIALVELMWHFNVKPSVVIGHSSGEIAAAYANGGINMASACKISYHRGRLANILKETTSSPGAMISVELSENEVAEYLNNLTQGQLHVACVNSPSNVTISGDEVVIDELKAKLAKDEVLASKLKTGVAYHSLHMQQIASDYSSCLQGLERSPNRDIKRPIMISSVTGEEISNLNILTTAEYWVSNMVQQVKFYPALKRMLSRSAGARKLGSKRLGSSYQAPIGDLVEVGPHSALQRPTRSILAKEAPQGDIRYHYILSRRKSAVETSLHLAAGLYSLGYQVALDQVNQTPDAVKGPALTNLPPYPFNHSKRYWHESDLSVHARLRRRERLELLGTPVEAWNPLEPQWRKFFDVHKTPWINDHKVDNRSVYPAAGMAVMATEAAKQISDPTRTISAYELKDTVFTSPIILDDVEQVEVRLFMRPTGNGLGRDSASFEYRICLRHTEWQETSRGYIRVLYERDGNELHGSDGNGQRNVFYQKQYKHARAACTNRVTAEQFYEHLEANGLTYGPSFRRLDDLAWDGHNIAVGKLTTFEWSPNQSRHSRQSHIVHPVTLDVAGQLMWVSLTKGTSEAAFKGSPVTRIQHAWMSASGLTYPQTVTLNLCSTSCPRGLRGTDSSMFALDDSGNVKLIIQHMETTSLAGDTNIGQSPARQIGFRMDWRPDLELMHPEQILEYCQNNAPSVAQPTDFFRSLDLVLYHFLHKTLDDIADLDVSTLQPHLQKYVSWLRMQAANDDFVQLPGAQSDRRSLVSDTMLMQSKISSVEESNVAGAFFVSIGKNLGSVIRGTTDPLEMMFQNGLAEANYQITCDNIASCKQLRPFLQCMAHKNPSMKIIEVGAGTGSITPHILSPLTDEGTGLFQFARYDYTDLSESFFGQAVQKFEGISKMHFGTLDIEQNPSTQGYAEGSYDLVVAAWVLHATRHLSKTVENVRKLLKPGGKLILLEATTPNVMRSGLAFGTLPGWWHSLEKCREWNPCISKDKWHEVLRESRFSGVDFELDDYEDKTCHENSVMVTTAVGKEKETSRDGKIFVVHNPKSLLQTAVTRLLMEDHRTIEAEFESISTGELLAVAPTRKDSIVFLVELEEPFLYSLDEPKFQALQRILQSCKDIWWVMTQTATIPRGPQVNMVSGLARVLSSENSGLQFVTIYLEDHKDSRAWASQIIKIIGSASHDERSQELEYMEKNGTLCINRVHEAKLLNERVHAATNLTLNRQELSVGPSIALKVVNPGSLESMRFIEDARHSSDLGPNDVEIVVKSVGINFRDLLVVLGRSSADTVGCECSGIITRIGENCTTLRPGDHVCAATFGCVQTLVQCDFHLVASIPSGMPFSQAATLPITAVTALYSLVTIANLQRHESVLIHSAAGGIGQVAIRIAQSLGAEVFATVSSDEKRQFIAENYQIPEDHIFYSRNTSFADGIRQATDNGVDVVLNSLAGEGLVASWECIAPFGRFIELGKLDIESNAKLPMAYFAKNASFTAVALDEICAKRPSLLGKLLATVVEQVRAGTLSTASPPEEFPISNVEGAFKHIQSGQCMGKVVLNLNPSDIVQMHLQHKSTYMLDSNHTYVIAGGFGGLGRSAARWMVQKGAKHLILLSRSGPKDQAASDMLAEFKSCGIQVATPRCDVCSLAALSDALDDCKTMPPIKGCLQATVVLRDSIFENMTFADWDTAIRSKVDSTWNLNTLLPSDLSFFIMISSVAGIMGNPGQANYAAGNTYQDALARYRLTRGLKATSIDLGWMSNIGVAAGSKKFARGKKGESDESELSNITEQEFLALLEYYCDPTLDYQEDDWRSQPIIGLVTPAQARVKGVEPAEWMSRPLFRVLEQIGVENDANALNKENPGAVDFGADFVRAGSDSDAVAIVLEAILDKLEKALSLTKSDFDTNRPLHVYGVDSLLAVELRNWFTKTWKADIAVFDITGSGSIGALADEVASKSGLREKS